MGWGAERSWHRELPFHKMAGWMCHSNRCILYTYFLHKGKGGMETLLVCLHASPPAFFLVFSRGLAMSPGVKPLTPWQIQHCRPTVYVLSVGLTLGYLPSQSGTVRWPHWSQHINSWSCAGGATGRALDLRSTLPSTYCQAVWLGTGQGAVLLRGWEGNRKQGWK